MTDDALFERLVLEINLAGLSWLTILEKREGFNRAYDGFRMDAVAAYGEEGPCPDEVESLQPARPIDAARPSGIARNCP